MSDQEQLIPLKDMARLDLKPGDILAIRVPRIFCDEQRAAMKQALESQMPGRKVIVLDGGMDIAAIRDPEAGAGTVYDPRDEQQAIEWCRGFALQGVIEAQVALAMLTRRSSR